MNRKRLLDFETLTNLDIYPLCCEQLVVCKIWKLLRIIYLIWNILWMEYLPNLIPSGIFQLPVPRYLVASSNIYFWHKNERKLTESSWHQRFKASPAKGRGRVTRQHWPTSSGVCAVHSPIQALRYFTCHVCTRNTIAYIRFARWAVLFQVLQFQSKRCGFESWSCILATF